MKIKPKFENRLLAIRYWLSASKGLTLIELVVAVGIFTTVVAAISGLFFSSIQASRHANATQNVVDEGRYVFEVMAKEIRNACVGTLCLVQLSNINAPPDTSTIQFTDANNVDIQYKLFSDPSGNRIQKSIGGGAFTDITSSQISITSLTFIISGMVATDNKQPKVTIAMTLANNRGSKAESQSSITLQTTVSQRLLDF